MSRSAIWRSRTRSRCSASAERSLAPDAQPSALLLSGLLVVVLAVTATVLLTREGRPDSATAPISAAPAALMDADGMTLTELEAFSTETPVRKELQAECIAWAVMAQQSGDYAPTPHDGTGAAGMTYTGSPYHGSGEALRRWALRGWYSEGDLSRCNTFAAPEDTVL